MTIVKDFPTGNCGKCKECILKVKDYSDHANGHLIEGIIVSCRNEKECRRVKHNV